MTRMVINFVFFQVAWFACVLGAAHGLPAIGPVVAAVVVGYHLWSAADPRPELVLLAAALVVGTVFDSSLVAAGWLVYPAGQWHPELAPYWILAIWLAFATTLNVSLRWLKGRPLLAAAFGAVGGPLAYLAGAGLGGVVLASPGAALAALGLGWAAIMPGLMLLVARLDAWPPRRPVGRVAATE